MTALAPAIIFPGTGQPANHGGRNYLSQGVVPSDLIPSLQMLHMFGSDFSTVYPEAQAVVDYSIGDHSRNGRPLTKIGSTPVGTKSFTSSASDFYLSPLTGAQLMALGTDGSFTAYVVAKFITPTFSAAMSTWNGTTTDGWVMGRLPIANRYNLQTTYANGALADQALPNINCDADTGVVYEFLACVYNLTALTVAIYRMKPGGTMQTSSNALSGVFSPLQRIAFGRSFPASNFEGPCEIVMGGCFSSAVSASDMQALQASTKTLVATVGVPI